MASSSSHAHKVNYSEDFLGVLKQRSAATDAAHLLPHLKPTSTILDIGCGPGSITVDFAQIAFEGCIIGVDIARVSLALAQKYVNDVKAEVAQASPPGKLGSVSFHELDVFKGLPFDDNTFDVVYSGQTFVHILSGDDGMARATGVMREVYRVLRPGGVMATKDLCGHHWYPSSHTLGKERLFENFVKTTIGLENPPGGDMPVVYRKAGFEKDKLIVSASTRVISGREKRERFGRIAMQKLEWPGHKNTFIREGNTAEEFEEMKTVLQNWIDDEDAWHTGVHTDVLAFK
ncbi:hypothetical protein VM1G_03573 [Cytospora mali]|uniref:Methyltransferase domain-containing protein n=1 Tax=Cytospora mali TaxID=578113 RepID=A0A194VU37_CYTMA|nr:hypothetical protein VM1G_03573 [Valsa mali]